MKAAGILGGGAAFLAVVGFAAVWLRPHQSSAGEHEEQTTPAIPPSSAAASLDKQPEKQSTANQPLRADANSLTLLGTLLPGEQSTLSVRQPAHIAAVLVREGQHVKKGQPLITLDTPEARPQEQNAEAGIATAQAQVDKARAGRQAQQVKADTDIATAQDGVTQSHEKLRQAQLNVQAARAADRADLVAAQAGVSEAAIGLKTAQDQLHSLEELDKVGGVARNDLEGARAQVKLAQSRLDTARAAVRRIQEGPNASGAETTVPDVAGTTYRVAVAQREEALAHAGVTQAETGLQDARKAKTELLRIADADVRAALAGVQQARAGLSGVQVSLETAHLNSPLTGTVVMVSAHVGETAQPGAPLLTVVASSAVKAYRVEALVPARQLSVLTVGQPARVLADTRPDQPLKAVVSTISDIAEPNGRTFRVSFRLLQPPASLRIGQNARVLIGR